MEFQEVHAYISKLSNTAQYDEYSDQEKAVFSAQEVLMDHYAEHRLTPRMVALQTLYMLEGEDEEFSKYKRHGVKSFSTKGVSVSFDGDEVAPAVVKLLSGPKVGRLI